MLGRVEPDPTVHAAEALVRRAWALALAQRCEYEEFALQVECENCDAALAILDAAQRDGDPRRIGAARTVASQARDSVRAAMAARDQARRTLHKELRLLTRKPKKLSAAAGGDQPRSWLPLLITNSRRRRGVSLRRLVRRRTADLGQQ